ncbi:MAG: hypothetical protein U0R44_00705 [Candidatus Micrarchaeia archaeon]
MIRPDISAELKSAAERRETGRRGEFSRAKSLHEGLSRRSGSSVLGRDEEGREKMTRKPGAFHIIVDRWYVRMGFKREDHEKLEGKTWLEVEARLKDGDIPRKLRRFDTHLITAVRVLKHVRRSYEQEISQTVSLLGSLDNENLALAAKKRGYTEGDIAAALSTLRSTDSALSSKVVALKRIVARKRIEKAVGQLESAGSMPPGGKRDMEVSRACAVLVSIRNRLDSWRNRQMAGIVEHNLQKECSMRLERDRWLFSQFSKFAEIPEAVAGYIRKDQVKLDALSEMRRLLRYRKSNEKLLSFIKDNSEHFRVGRRDGREAERMIALSESGIQPLVGANIDYQLGRLRAVYRNVLRGNKARAREHIDSLELFVRANKPEFILSELGKSPDPYLGPVLEHLVKAASALEKEDFVSAKGEFAAARDSIALYAYPRPG